MADSRGDLSRAYHSPMDEFAGWTQPHCLECGTVLHDDRAGFVCRNCKLIYLPSQLLQTRSPLDRTPTEPEGTP
ncbi:hypothetical protein ACWPKO_30085 (plasmid) [Coraliomargarita sp. W4R53]